MRHNHHRLLRPALLAGLALLTAAAMTQPAQAQATDNLSPDPWPVRLVVPGQQFTPAYVFNGWYGQLPTGVVYLRNDLQQSFTRLPLAAVSESAGYGARALVARVPASLVRGHLLFYYAVLRDATSGHTATIPAGGASNPERAWVLNRPLSVSLGTHTFGHLSTPQAIVAKAAANQVGWESPPPDQDGNSFGPWSFDVARDGSIWLLDQVNRRLLVWQPGRPDRPARTVPLPFKAPVDLALGADDTIYATSMPAGGPDYLYALTSTGQVRWKALLPQQRTFGSLLLVDGVVYYHFTDWTPMTSTRGQPLAAAEQRRLTSPDQPLPHRLRLASQSVPPNEGRVGLINQASQLLRAWRITSQTELDGTFAKAALVHDDLVVTLQLSKQTKGKFLWEYLVLRLAPNNTTRVQLTLAPPDRVTWGDTPVTGLRVGPDGQLYQLRTDRTTGVSIARYSLSPKPTPPTTITQGKAPAPPPPATNTPAPTVTAPTTPLVQQPTTPPVQPQPTTPSVQTQPAWRALLPWLAAVAAVALAAAGELWWWRRRQRRHPAGPGRPHPAH